MPSLHVWHPLLMGLAGLAWLPCSSTQCIAAIFLMPYHLLLSTWIASTHHFRAKLREVHLIDRDGDFTVTSFGRHTGEIKHYYVVVVPEEQAQLKSPDQFKLEEVRTTSLSVCLFTCDAGKQLSELRGHFLWMIPFTVGEVRWSDESLGGCSLLTYRRERSLPLYTSVDRQTERKWYKPPTEEEQPLPRLCQGLYHRRCEFCLDLFWDSVGSMLLQLTVATQLLSPTIARKGAGFWASNNAGSGLCTG